MANEFNVVDVWTGRFSSPDTLTEYLRETYSGDDHQPISHFARDQDQIYYDHDFLESIYFEATQSLSTALGSCSFANFFVEDAGAAYVARCLPSATVAVLAFGPVIHKPRSVERQEYQLFYLGRFQWHSES